MLFYKFWYESRIRFLLSAVFLISVCGFVVQYYGQYCRQVRLDGEEPLEYATYIWTVIFRSGNSLREVFCILAMLLGLGGLLRERAQGTAGFTLALPIQRWQLTFARGAVGFLEVTALSFVPALMIPVLSRVFDESYPLMQALQFGVLWSACGAAIFSIAFLCSTLFEGEYAAPVAALIAIVAYSVAVSLPALEIYPLNIHTIMSGEGMAYFRAEVSELATLPWTLLVCIVVATALPFSVAVYLTQRQDF